MVNAHDFPGLGSPGTVVIARGCLAGGATEALELGEIALHRLEGERFHGAVAELPVIAGAAEVVYDFAHAESQFTSFHLAAPVQIDRCGSANPSGAENAAYMPKGDRCCRWCAKGNAGGWLGICDCAGACVERARRL